MVRLLCPPVIIMHASPWLVSRGEKQPSNLRLLLPVRTAVPPGERVVLQHRILQSVLAAQRCLL